MGKSGGLGRAPGERIVQDVLRFPVALDAIIEAQGAKVKGKGARKGRRGAKRYVPPSCPEAERLTRVKFEWFGPERDVVVRVWSAVHNVGNGLYGLVCECGVA